MKKNVFLELKKTSTFQSRNEFHFSEVHRSVNYCGLCAKRMNPKGLL